MQLAVPTTFSAQDLLDLGRGKALDVRAAAAAGIRDQPLDRAEARLGGLDRSGHLRPVGDVARQRQRLAAGRLDLGCKRIEQGLAARDQRQRIFCEAQRQAAADTR